MMTILCPNQEYQIGEDDSITFKIPHLTTDFSQMPSGSFCSWKVTNTNQLALRVFIQRYSVLK